MELILARYDFHAHRGSRINWCPLIHTETTNESKNNGIRPTMDGCGRNYQDGYSGLRRNDQQATRNQASQTHLPAPPFYPTANTRRKYNSYPVRTVTQKAYQLTKPLKRVAFTELEIANLNLENTSLRLSSWISCNTN